MTIQNRTYVDRNIVDHEHLRKHLLQQCPQLIPLYIGNKNTDMVISITVLEVQSTRSSLDWAMVLLKTQKWP
jgi:hypothetical protein